MFSQEKTKEFLLLRLKDNGGFGATPLLPSTLEDTYFGTLASFFLSATFFKEVKPKIKRFLFQLNFYDLHDPFKLYQGIKLYQVLDVELPSELKEYIKEKLTLWSLSEALKPARIFALWYLSKFINEKMITTALENRASSFEFKTLEELFYLSEINHGLKDKYLDFVLRSQNGDGGFGFYPGTTSFLENTFYALKILSGLSIHRNVFHKAQHFIRACYNDDGGFARKPGGISFLESTAFSIEILNSLSKSMSI